jgi:Mlc titration factor MtfA (ptsG expression regulator)
MANTILSVLLIFRWWYVIGRGGKGGGGSDDISGFEFAILCVVVIFLLFAIYYRVTKSLEKRSTPGTKKIKLNESLSSIHKSILSEKSNYYNQLSKSDKEPFEKRVRYYMEGKMFTSEDGYAVTDEMKVMISAAACQITFGLPVSANTTFTHILIMPNAQMQPRTATRTNTIILPWREFVEGYENSNDGQNEGLKVMATALVRDNRLQDKANKLLPAKKYAAWEDISLKESENFMGGMFQAMETDDRMRDEYFANAIVYFFELPVAFKQKYPKLYEAIADLLGQDPIKKTIRK